jgi:hypothetical protein
MRLMLLYRMSSARFESGAISNTKVTEVIELPERDMHTA